MAGPLWEINDPVEPEKPIKPTKSEQNKENMARYNSDMGKYKSELREYEKDREEYIVERNVERVSSVIFRPLDTISSLFDVSIKSIFRANSIPQGIIAAVATIALAGPMVGARLGTAVLSVITGLHSQNQQERSRDLAGGIGEKIYGVRIDNKEIINFEFDYARFEPKVTSSKGGEWYESGFGVREGMKKFVGYTAVRGFIGMFSVTGKVLQDIGKYAMKSMNKLGTQSQFSKSIEEGKENELKSGSLPKADPGNARRPSDSSTVSTVSSSNTSESSNSSDKERPSPKM